jgi:hypothetical protein
MEGMMTLEPAEACEAMRAYLVLRGSLPAHGTVLVVEAEGDSSRYTASKIKVKVSIVDPVKLDATTPEEGGAK